MLAALVRGELDLALSETPLPKGPLDAVALCADPFVVAAAGGRAARAAAQARSTAHELARLPLIAHAPSRAHVEEELRTHGVEPRFVLQAETGSGVQGLVAAGLGAAVVPRVAADERRARPRSCSSSTA